MGHEKNIKSQIFLVRHEPLAYMSELDSVLNRAPMPKAIFKERSEVEKLVFFSTKLRVS